MEQKYQVAYQMLQVAKTHTDFANILKEMIKILYYLKMVNIG